MGKRGPKKGNPYKYTKGFIERQAIMLLKYAQTCEMIPMEQEFAPKQGYHSSRLSEWAKINKKLSEALKRLKDIQTHKLVVLSLGRKIDTAMAIFTLKNIAGWRDRQEVEHSGEIKGGETRIVIIRPDGKPDTEDERIQNKVEAIPR